MKIFFWKITKEQDNAGDYFGYYLLQKMLPFNLLENCNYPDIICCGSIINNRIIKNNTKIWGCGLHNSCEAKKILFINKNHFFAVRGKLTSIELNLKNVTFGDTGLLASYFYHPTSKKKYKFGIVAHWRDEEYFKNNFANVCPIISMCTNKIDNLLEQINECDFIFSSSLHGIIFAHSLGIPAINIEYNKLESKNNFKFKDYYSAIHMPYIKKKFSSNSNFLNVYLNNKKAYCPNKEKIKKIQINLLKSFPLRNEIIIFTKITKKFCINNLINWIKHHNNIGVNRIYISTKKFFYHQILKYFINKKNSSNVVEIIKLDEKYSFEYFLDKYKYAYDWGVYLALDEYVFEKKVGDFKKLLKEKKDFYKVKLKIINNFDKKFLFKDIFHNIRNNSKISYSKNVSIKKNNNYFNFYYCFIFYFYFFIIFLFFIFEKIIKNINFCLNRICQKILFVKNIIYKIMSKIKKFLAIIKICD